MSLTGQILGIYRLGAELGRGGMGTVYRAEAMEDGPGGAAGSTVAIKVFRPELVADQKSFERFQREAEIGMRIRHPHVVRTFDVGQSESDGAEHHFMVMEVIEGQTLDDLVEDLGTVPEHLLYQIADQVLDALETVHERGVIHRDIKPENIVITPDHRVLLMDLGVARLQEKGHTLTTAGEFVGSILYAAPEQFLGDADIGARCDLYAFGVVLYKLATGRDPYGEQELSAVIGQKLHGEIAPPREVHADVDPFWNEVITTCTRRELSGRFATAAELRQILKEGEASEWWRQKTAGRALPSAFPALKRIRPQREVSLVGRDEDVERLRGVYEQAIREGGAHLMGGSTGVGKSRLLYEFLESVASPGGPAIVAGRCVGAGGRSFQPFIEAVTDLLETDGRDALESRLGDLLTDTPGVVTSFVDFLLGGLQPGPESGFDQDALLATFANLLRQAAAERPIVLAIEDLHLAGPATLDLFAYLARCIPGHAIFLLGVFSEDEVEEGSQLQDVIRGTETLQLQPLTVGATEEIVRAVAGHSRTVRALAWPVYEKSDGNPLVILELLHHMQVSGELVPFEDHLQLAGKVDEISLPSSLQELVELKLSRLDDDQRETLEAATVLGYVFDASLLASVLEEKRIKLLKRLAILERKYRLLRSSGRSSFRFASHQLHEVIYEGISPALRSEYHSVIADTIRDELDDDEPDGETAFALLRHLLHASRGLEAEPFLGPALDHTINRYHASVGAPFLEKVATAFDVARPNSRFAISMKLWIFYEMLGRREDQVRVLEQARAFAEETGEPGPLGRAISCLGATHWFAGEHEEAAELLDRAIELSREAGDRKWEATSLHTLGGVAWRQGDAARAADYWRQALAIRREIGDRKGQASSLIGLGAVMPAIGEGDKALATKQEALGICHEIGARRFECKVLNNIGVSLLRGYESEEAVRHFEGAVAIARELGEQHSEMLALGNLGEAYAALGRIVEAKEHMERAIEFFREIGRPNAELITRIQLARSIGVFGERDDVERHLRKAVETSEQVGDSANLVRSLRELGRRLHQWGQRDEGRTMMERALEVSETLGVPERSAEVLSCLGHAALQEEDYDRAVDHLQESLSKTQAGVSSGTLLIRCRLVSAYRGAGRLEDAAACAAEAKAQLEGMESVSPEHAPEIHYRLSEATDDEDEKRRHLTTAERILSTRAQSITGGTYREHFLTQTGHNRAILEEARRLLRG